MKTLGLMAFALSMCCACTSSTTPERVDEPNPPIVPVEPNNSVIPVPENNSIVPVTQCGYVGSSDYVGRGQLHMADFLGSYVIGVSHGGLETIDVSDPERPVFPTPGSSPLDERGAYLAAIDGDMAYVGTSYWKNYVDSSNYRLVVIDVSNPSEPVRRGSVDVADVQGYAYVSAVDGYVYLWDDDRLAIVDSTNPDEPVHLRTMTTSIKRYVEDAVRIGNRLFAVGRGDNSTLDGGSVNFVVIGLDVSDPGNPREVTQSTVGPIRGRQVPRAQLAWVGDDILMVIGTTLIEDMAMEGVEGDQPLTSTPNADAFVLDVSGDLRVISELSLGDVFVQEASGDPESGIVVALTSDGLVALDASDPETVRIGAFGEWPVTFQDTGSVEVAGTEARIVVHNQLVKLDISDIDLLKTIEATSLGRTPNREAIQTAFATPTTLVLADAEGGAAIYDLSDISAPKEVSRVLEGQMTVHDVWASGEYMVVREVPGPLVAYDISNPSVPERIGEIISSRQVVLRDRWLSLIDGDGLHTFDLEIGVSAPHSQPLDHPDGNAHWMLGATENALVVGSIGPTTMSLEVFSVGPDTPPEWVLKTELPTRVYSIQALKNHFIFDGQDGRWVLNEEDALALPDTWENGWSLPFEGSIHVPPFGDGRVSFFDENGEVKIVDVRELQSDPEGSSVIDATFTATPYAPLVFEGTRGVTIGAGRPFLTFGLQCD